MATIVGAGAVGLALGARLAHSGVPVRFVVRRREAAERLAEEGVAVEDPASGEAFEAPVTATTELASDGDGPLLVCVRLPDLAALAPALGAAARGAPVVTFQNDVGAEDAAASHVRRVIGGVWRQTCTRLDDRSVRFTGHGRVIVGLHPHGRSPTVDALVERLRAAGYDTGLSTAIQEDKWLKLFVNLMSAPNALVRRADHTRPAFIEVKVRLLEEGRAAIQAAGIPARSCDGRDRNMAEEIAFQRASLSRGTSARRLPIYNQVWASLGRGAPLESAGYHRRIIDLARRHDLPTATHERVLAALERAHRDHLGPESLAAEDLLPT